jgi:hypothetical protein
MCVVVIHKRHWIQNDVLHDVEKTFSKEFLQNILRFYGRRLNKILFTPIIKYGGLPWTDFHVIHNCSVAFCADQIAPKSDSDCGKYGYHFVYAHM